MAYRDLRDWLTAVERDGELKHIRGAHWDLEMNGIAEIAYRRSKQPVPALLFDDIPGYPKGYRGLFDALSSPRRVARSLYLPLLDGEIKPLDIVRSWRDKTRDLKLIPPRTVASGAVQENSFRGEDVDVTKFPVPRCHELDGGRYIGTGNAVIQQDPDTGWVNLGIYRCMLVDRNRIALHVLEGQHGRVIGDKYSARKRAMPVAVAIGVDPALWFAAGQRIPWGTSEYDYAGGIKGEPIDVITGPCTGLPLPASAEIVIEGECIPGDVVDEGPFGEWNGYYANQGLEPVPEPVIRVKSVLHRHDPILTSAPPAAPPSMQNLIRSVTVSSAVWTTLEKVGIPGITGVWTPSEGASRMLVVISIRQMYAGHSMDVGLVAAQAVGNMGRYVAVVDEDIDPSNFGEVMWAITTRTVPERSIQMFRHCGSSSADSALSPDLKRQHKPLFGTRVVIDACRPYESRAAWYPVARISSDLEGKLLKKWESLFKELS